jgi:hypothetical protein
MPGASQGPAGRVHGRRAQRPKPGRVHATLSRHICPSCLGWRCPIHKRLHGPVQGFAVVSPCSASPVAAPLDSCPCQPGNDDVSNLMAGGQDSCLLHFTCGQAQRMHAAYWHYRANVTDEEMSSLVARAKLAQLQGAESAWSCPGVGRPACMTSTRSVSVAVCAHGLLSCMLSHPARQPARATRPLLCRLCVWRHQGSRKQRRQPRVVRGIRHRLDDCLARSLWRPGGLDLRGQEAAPPPGRQRCPLLCNDPETALHTHQSGTTMTMVTMIRSCVVAKVAEACSHERPVAPMRAQSTTRTGHITFNTHCELLSAHVTSTAHQSALSTPMKGQCGREQSGPPHARGSPPVTSLPSPPSAAPSSGTSVEQGLYAAPSSQPALRVHVMQAIDQEYSLEKQCQKEELYNMLYIFHHDTRVA